jgi:hypothetical protein
VCRDANAVAKVLEAVGANAGASPFALRNATGLCDSDLFHAIARLYAEDRAIYKRGA